jgi:uncharacterized protein YdiU (UPF0061 family)
MFAPVHSFRQLPAAFFSDVTPTPVALPSFIAFNQDLAQHLALPSSYWQTEQGLALFSGLQLPEWTKPLAAAYTGHQFGSLAPRLGDGRAILLTELTDASGKNWDVQLKGAGPTPYSRRGDGRAALGPVLREYLVSEAMHALGVPTTRALAAVMTGEPVYRQRPLPGAIITRVADSFLRIGSFQYAAMYASHDERQALLDFAINRHYPECAQAENPALAFLAAVQQRQAKLIAKWMSLGFIHGVMNTDNMSISGETIDYGPCAFMDNYRGDTVFSSIDTSGRYAYQQQPQIGQWNLARLAESLLPLIAADETEAVAKATEVLNNFGPSYFQYWRELFGAKIGLSFCSSEDQGLIVDVLQLLQNAEIDFTIFFRKLAYASNDLLSPLGPHTLFADAEPWLTWASQWQQRLAQEDATNTTTADKTSLQDTRIAQMLRVNPAFIPRNHQIEQIIEAASERNDFTQFEQFRRDLTTPYQDNPLWMAAPAPSKARYQTFCGT